MSSTQVSLVGRLLVVLGLASSGVACMVSVDAGEVKAREEKRFTVSGRPELSLVTFDGSIEVRAWDRAEVFVEIEKRAADEATVKGIEVKAEQTGNRISVEARQPERTRRFLGFGVSPSAHVVASVPRESDVVVRSGDGAIAIERVSGRIELNTGDGAIRARELTGDLRAHSGDGSVRLEDIDGRVDVDTGDGGVVVAGKLSGVRVRTADGSVRVRIADGSAMTDDWEIRTGDGGVSLELPGTFGAELDATAGDGSVRVSELELTATGEKSAHAAKGRLGAGGRLLRVRTGDGSIVIRKG
jgi:hypothetical protein